MNYNANINRSIYRAMFRIYEHKKVGEFFARSHITRDKIHAFTVISNHEEPATYNRFLKELGTLVDLKVCYEMKLIFNPGTGSSISETGPC